MLVVSYGHGSRNPSLSPASLGTVSDRHAYDRLTGRP
jgi:hypothetical protein